VTDSSVSILESRTLMRPRLALLCLVMIAGSALLAAPAWMACDRRPARRPDVILIVIDTLRADHLGAYGYDRDTSPVLDAFARQNVKFNFAIATSPWTAPSVASVFTGLYPTVHGVVGHAPRRKAELRKEVAALDDELETLAEALKKAGYRTAGITANAWVADYLGFAQGFDGFDTINRQSASQVNELAFDFLESVAVDDAPFFLYLHYMDPHAPYKLPRDARRFPPRSANRHYDSEMQRRLAGYDAEIRYVDAKIGELFDFLREKGLYDRAVIVVTGDHGEQFREHGGAGHGFRFYNEEIHVPLMLRANELRAEIDHTVSLLDIYPTLLELTDAESTYSTQGVSLLRPASERTGVLSETNHTRNQRAFTSRSGNKLILSFRSAWIEIEDERTQQKVVGLFDSRRDRFERSPLEDDQLLDEMRSSLDELYRDSLSRRRRVAAPAVKLNEETIRELEALGYLE